MKTIFKKWTIGLLAAVATLAGGCTDPDGIVEELDVDRVFSPLNFEVLLENNVNATFSWIVSNGIENYQLDLQYEDGTSYQVQTIPVVAEAITKEGKLTYFMPELPGKTKFVASLYALSVNPDVDNSKPAQCSFETGVEQLFLNDGLIPDADITATSAVLRWLAGSNVTHLDVDNGVGTIQLDETAKAAGVYTLTGLKTGTLYTVNLCRDTAVRGTTSFTASDKHEVSVLEKTANAVTLGWPATAAVDEIRITPATENGDVFKLTSDEQAAHAYAIKGLKSLTDYRVSIYIAGVESGSMSFKTMGKSTKWDFTTWEAQTFAAPTTIDGLLINANAAADSGKEMYISADADFGCNYLDLKGKSSNAGKEGQAPTDRSVMFSVDGEGVISIDCYANGAGRHFAVYIESLGTNTEKFEAPVKADRGKVYIPVTGFTGTTNLYIWTDATINHVYSIEWTEGAEAPGQMATALATPEVTVTPTMVNVGEAAGLEIAWKAIENASSYTWALKGATDAEGNPIGGTTSELKVSVPAEVVAALAPATYTASVVAVPSSTYLYKNSAAGTADFTVSDMVLATPKVTFTPAKVVAGDETEVVASWEAVMNAASYQVSFNGGAATTQTETSYTLSAADVKALAAGEYKISVVALPDPNDAGREQSAAGEATLTVDTPPVTPPSGDVSLIWDFADASFDAVAATIGTDNSFTSSVEWNGLTIDGGGKTMKMNGSGSSRGVQPGGAGSETQRYFAFTAPAGGTLTVTSSNTGSSEDMTRMVTVSLDGTVVASQPGGTPTSAPTVTTFDITAAGQVKIYPTGNGLRFYKIEFTSVAAAEPVVYSWGHDYYAELITTYGTGDQKADLDMGNGLKYYVGSSGKWKVGSDDTSLTDGTKINRIQFGGSGKPGNTPMQNVMELVVEGPGTLEMTIRSASKTDIRTLAVTMDGVAVTGSPFNAPVGLDSTKGTGDAAATYTIDCSAAKAGSVILLYSTNSGINLYDLTWTGK